MAKLCKLLSAGCSTLAVVLMSLGVLTASPYAWADNPGGSCVSDGDCSGYACSNGVCLLTGTNCQNCQVSASTTCTSTKTPPCTTDGTANGTKFVCTSSEQNMCQYCNCAASPNDNTKCGCN
jgi:hypothetical protein